MTGTMLGTEDRRKQNRKGICPHGQLSSRGTGKHGKEMAKRYKENRPGEEEEGLGCSGNISEGGQGRPI